ncbi:MAG: nucleoside deaminase [Psychrobacter sp.]|nr:nucleoside deaminase [Psychrobacter sp.]
MVTDKDMPYLQRAIALAAEALGAGDEPFGSVLVDASGTVLYEDRNRVNTQEATYHPEIAVARWAAENLAKEARQSTTVYTSGEHCAMCSAAHAWAGLGRIVYVSSSQQLGEWLEEWGVANQSPINALPIGAIAPNIEVEGPVPELVDEIKQLQKLSNTQG